MRALAITAVGLGVAGASAAAQPADGGEVGPRHAPIAHRINLRAGLASSDDVGRPTICLEVVAALAISIEGCGTGSGIVHDEPGRELAHFRANVPLVVRASVDQRVSLRAGLGFAELQIADDRPGFQFGSPDHPGSVAGPDLALSVQWLRRLHGGLDLVANATTGMAWFAGAGELVEPQRAIQPYVGVELGVGW